MREALYKLKWRRFHPQAFSRYRQVKVNERLSLDQLMVQQEQARRRIVKSAMENTIFYRRHYGSVGFELGDIGKEGWFERLPILTKQYLREQFEEIANQSLKRFRLVSTTGGSTGTPTKTGYDGRIPEEVYSWRLQNWFGVHPWDDHAYVWRETRKTHWAKFKNALMWWPTRHLKLDATFISEADIVAFLKKFNAMRPALLQGYVGAITQLAQYVVDHACVVWAPRFVWVTSAPLSAVQRALVKRAFGAPICDQYGSCEVRWIAQSCCEEHGLHVNVDHVHIEFVDENGAPVPRGAYGRTLLTNLEDEVFPMIRYENGDRGRWLNATCACGRNLPLIDSVKGRESESFTLPSGRIINGEYLTTIFDEMPDLVSGFRCVQHKDLSITVEYMPVGPEQQILKVLREFENKLGHEVPVDIKSVESLQHDRGKLRFIEKEQ